MIELELRFEHEGKKVIQTARLENPTDAPLDKLEPEFALWAEHFARCVEWFALTGGPEKRT